MQSIRGLRRAIPSNSPRYAFLPCSSGHISSSAARRSVRQTLQLSRTERLGAIKEDIEGHVETEHRKRLIYTSKEDVKPTPENANGIKTTKVRLEKPSVLAGSAHSKDSTQGHQDLCASVTATMARLPHPAVVVTTLDRTYHAQAAAGVPVEEMRHPIARGITVSSFTSLCIRPRPHVMFNMTLPSTMYEALITCKDFNVHILTPDEAGARIASVFTRGNRIPPPRLGEAMSSKYDLDVDADLGVFVGLKEEGLPHVEILNRNAWHKQYQDAKERDLTNSESSHDTDPTEKHSEAIEATGQMHHVPHLDSQGIIEVLNCRLVRTIYPDLPNAGQNAILIGEVVGVVAPKKSNEEADQQVPIALGYANRKYRCGGDAIHLA
ncbi:hypothetical protein RRF57_002853 [Xylaria bambusicola]|uniref:Flavin reductase like domain-containing protein n=1 Tax=Xylaria bambusicola TaxID=326684 RepID=A0AAN7UF83_9PEZI